MPFSVARDGVAAGLTDDCLAGGTGGGNLCCAADGDRSQTSVATGDGLKVVPGRERSIASSKPPTSTTEIAAAATLGARAGCCHWDERKRGT